MKSNGLLKWLMVPLLLAVLLIIVKLLPNSKSTSTEPVEIESQLTPEEMKALGLEGDTPSDTVATLVAQVRQLRAELRNVQNDDQRPGDPLSLRRFEETLEQRIQLALEQERQRVHDERAESNSETETESLLQELQRRLDTLGQREAEMDVPLGFGLENGDGARFSNGIRWIEPEDAKPQDPSGHNEMGLRFPTQFGPAQKTLGEMADSITSHTSAGLERPIAKPTYTVPPNSTLMGSVAMTALIGRIPIDGTVNDPYPFKVLIGADNLTANGIDLPEIAGAVVSGTASGDWTLSCVRGQIRSITFVFQDGTIRTLPGDSDNDSRDNKQNSANSGATQEGLGWISDKHGIPCVAGKRRSNAQQYLGTQALITAAGVGVTSMIKSDGNSTVYAGNQSGSLGTVGVSGSEAMNRLLASGVQDISQWVNKLYGQAFAAVYVDPGAQVAVHIEQPLTFDYDAQGRKVDHTLGGRHVTTELD
ncbi:integrating conjugative element protein (TIGR03752 family) [Pseudomonas sp. LAIL14HWK12:I2]|uniref:TIGR03752 family integrating conjugative element protein n=1 Tax=Pseudomonas sp. LAIL14HWK12:I2 TaxID=1265482 RepID=UPI001067F97C|nr:TIGR03752 family integrating conjugative element protein [Pseudomonas sp. LAIL14HWK12:I2]TFA85148.1 integrating conjugative element protein (TIGR03752 family) [Pseudomonas sp. LAIL14HWK12:I2]